MKISSVSKKVLASALSAAMVVAFAPTVAFGAPAQGDAAKVHFVTAVGANAESTATDGTTAPKDVNIVLGASGVTGDITVANADKYTYYGAAIKGWFYDANKDGKYTADQAGDESGDIKDATLARGTLKSFTPVSTFKDGDVLNAVAIYDLTELGAVNQTIVQGTISSDTQVFSIPVALKSAATDSLKLTVKKGSETLIDGKVITEADIDSNGDAIVIKATATASKAGKVDTTTGNIAYIDAAKYGAGEYTFSIEATSGYTSTATAKIDTITLGNGGDASILIGDGSKTVTFLAADNDVLPTATVNAIKAVSAVTGAGKYNSANGNVDANNYVWATADGTVVSTATKVTGDLALVPVYGFVQKASAINFNGGAKTMSFNLNNAVTIAAKSDTTGIKSATFSVQGPAGTILSIKKEAGDAAASLASNITLTFGGTANTAEAWDNSAVTTQKLAAGTYTGTYTLTDADGVSKSYSSSVELVNFTVVTGDEIDPLTAAQLKTIPGLVAKGQTMDTAYYEGTAAGTFNLPGTKTSSTKSVKEWAVSGLTVVSTGKALEKVAAASDLMTLATSSYKATGPVTLTAVYQDAKAALPAVSVSGTTVTLTAAEGTTVQYKTTGGWITYAGPFTLAATDKTFQVAASKAGVATNTATYNRYDNGAQANVKAFATVLGQTPLATAANYAANDETFKAAVAAADAKVVSEGFAVSWTATEQAAEGELVAALATALKADLAKLNVGVVAENGTATKISDAAYKDACDKLDKIVAAWALNTDKDANNDVAVSGNKPSVAAADYKADMILEANAAIAKKSTYKKADVDAAAAVTAQLKDPKTAAAGLEAYKSLSAAAKELVPAADLAAAEEAIAAAELKDAQDDAAVSKARNTSKTVKAGKNGKTTKKQSVTLKKITSKSGAKVTYKKSSGSSKVTVKSGKAYLAKGVKKGTYKATVKATCGTQTAKIKVTFKVK